MLHKEIPFLRLGLPLCLGIISGLYINPGNLFLAGLTIIIIAGFCISLLFNKYQSNLLYGYSITISLFTCGLLLYTFEKNSLSSLKPEKALYHCILSDFPEEKENSYRLKIKLINKITSKGYEKVKGSMIIYNKKDTSLISFTPGDVLVINCSPILIANRGNPYEFDYKFYMASQGIKYYAFTSPHDIFRNNSPSNRGIKYKALIIREKIISMYEERGITGERLAVIAAITLGQKNMLDPEQKQSFARAGVMHVMAVSGLHIGIISIFVFNLLYFLKGKYNLLRVLITILILWSFAFVTGLTPSVLRATLMFSLLHSGKLMKRRINGINSVLASAFIILLIRPSTIFNAGFLLSYSAVIYIISFYSDLYKTIHLKNWFADKIWQSATITIVAQAGTLPLTIMLFNRFSTFFIFTNILIIPLTTLLIITGCLVPLTYSIHFLSNIIAQVLNFLAGITESFAGYISSLPGSSVENIGMTTPECVFLTFTIFLFSYFILKKKSFSIKYPIGVVLIYAMTNTFSDVSTKASNEIIIFNTPGASTIGIRTGKILNLYSDNPDTGPDIDKECATLGLKKKIKILENHPCLIKAGDKKILISNYRDMNNMQNISPDILIVTYLEPYEKNIITIKNKPEAVIFTARANMWHKILLQKIFPGADTIHLVNHSGAFIKKI